MQRLRIMTDSACDLPQQIADELDIRVLPIPITHEGKAYSERVELTNEQFYDLLLGSKEIPTTAHINAETYLEEYKKAKDEGYTGILNVTINSLGSSMYDASCLARRRFYEETGTDEADFRIDVIDSKTYTMAYGAAVAEAAKMARAGETVDAIIAYLEDWFSRLELLFSVYSLDFVKKSGRVGCAAAFVGELLGLRPLILFKDGVATVIDKVRGDKNVVPKLLEAVKKRSRDADKYPFAIIRGTPVNEAKEFEELIHNKLNVHCEGVFTVGASVAINCGPKVVAAVYAGEKRER